VGDVVVATVGTPILVVVVFVLLLVGLFFE
jgi:hypothetical protein